MSVSINQSAPQFRSILAPIIVLGVLVFLTFLAVEATQPRSLANTQEETVTLPATQPLEGVGRGTYRLRRADCHAVSSLTAL